MEGDDCEFGDFEGINKIEASSNNRDTGRIKVYPGLARLSSITPVLVFNVLPCENVMGVSSSLTCLLILSPPYLDISRATSSD